MPTTYSFGHAIGAAHFGGSASDGTDGTITADIDDGTIAVGDKVVVDGFDNDARINGAVGGDPEPGDPAFAYYQGSQMFDGKLGFVFTDFANFGDSLFYFVVFDAAVMVDAGTLSAVEAFAAAQVAPTGTSPVCFLADTQIATPQGVCSVQNLAIGDPILTADGATVSVKWIGRQTVSTRFGPAERLTPVLFAKGSLGNGLPHSDLTVTADHAMLVSGVLCNAAALVNNSTITRVPLSKMDETYTIYHIETEAHEIILANGAAAETFIDNVSRRVFDNFAEFEALYGDVPEMEELPYPRAMSARQVPTLIQHQLSLRCIA